MNNENNIRIPRFCSRCGNQISSEMQHCPICGLDLKFNIARNNGAEAPLENREQASPQNIREQYTEQPSLQNIEGQTPWQYPPVYGQGDIPYGYYGMTAAPVVEEKRLGNHPLSVTAFVLSLVSIIPFLTFFTVLPAFVLSIVGLVKSKAKKRKKGLGITALVISAVLLAVVIFFVAVFIIDETVTSADPQFMDYSYISEEPWINVSEDYIIIDTNPDDKMNYSEADAFYEIEEINSDFGFADDLYDRMIETSPADGVQTECSENGEFYVSWSYHPQKGLEITYTKNDNSL